MNHKLPTKSKIARQADAVGAQPPCLDTTPVFSKTDEIRACQERQREIVARVIDACVPAMVYDFRFADEPTRKEEPVPMVSPLEKELGDIYDEMARINCMLDTLANSIRL